MTRRNGLLLFLLAAAVAVRLLPLAGNWHRPLVFLEYDSWGYHQLGVNLHTGHGYSAEAAPPYLPNVYRPPGLPVVLAGLGALTGDSVPAAILLQHLVALATVLMTYRLARVLGANEPTALAAAALLALEPVTTYYTNLLLSEVYTALVVTAVVAATARYLQSAEKKYLALTVGLLAAGILIHPILLLLPAGVALAVLVRGRGRFVGRLAAAAAVLLALVPAAGWMARNYAVTGYANYTCVGAINLMKYKAASVCAELNGTSREVERDRLTRECEALLPADAAPALRWRAWERKGVEILMRHPLLYARLHAQGMVVELFGPERDLFSRMAYGGAAAPAGGRLSDDGIRAAADANASPGVEALRYLTLAWQAACLALLAVGVVSLWRRQRGLLLALTLPALYIMLLTGGSEASPRFRVIYTPLLCVCAGVGFHTVCQWVRLVRAGQPGMLPERGALAP
jgi:hypothetical protein